jgi:hypothetical protein
MFSPQIQSCDSMHIPHSGPLLQANGESRRHPRHRIRGRRGKNSGTQSPPFVDSAVRLPITTKRCRENQTISR